MIYLDASVGCSINLSPVISISGDGGFQMNAQELTTIVEHKLPVKIVVINNGFLGMVRQWQELFWRRRYSHVELSNPDFVKLAEAHGCPGIKVTKTAEVEDALRLALDKEGPVLIEFVVEKEDNVYPMIPAAQSVHEMIDTPEPVDDKETSDNPVTILEKGNNVQQRAKRPGRSKVTADAE